MPNFVSVVLGPSSRSRSQRLGMDFVVYTRMQKPVYRGDTRIPIRRTPRMCQAATMRSPAICTSRDGDLFERYIAAPMKSEP